MIKTLDQCSLFGPAGHGWSSGRLPDQFGRLERLPVTNIAQELQKAHISWSVGFAEPPQHPQIGVEHGQQALRARLMDRAARRFCPRVLAARMVVAPPRPVAAGRVRREPTARAYRAGGRLLHRLHGEICGCLADDRALAAAPRQHRGPVCVIMAPPRRTLLAAPRRATPP